METKEMLGRLEARFDKWLDEFEQRPISMGIKVVIVVLFLRWIWRSFK